MLTPVEAKEKYSNLADDPLDGIFSPPMRTRGSTVLPFLLIFPQAAPNFAAMKDEASISRLYGGIHYRSDIERGKEHGARIGGYAVRFAQQDGAN